VPFIKIDKGLEDEAGRRPADEADAGADALLERARRARRVRHQGALGDQLGQPAGIAAIVKQQFEVGRRCSPHG
jgi:fructose-bisphosphate aldolase, class I